MRSNPSTVIPAKAGINSGYRVGSFHDLRQFTPASAGVTEKAR